MEVRMERSPLNTWEAVCDSLWEAPLEWDVLLPEGNPDIARLLCAQATPWQEGWNVSGKQLTVQGTVQVTALYLDEEGTLCQAEFRMPVSKTIELPQGVEKPVCRVELMVEYYHCRMVNPRRLDMRGSLSVWASLWQQHEQPVLTEGCGCGVELRRQPISCCRLLPTAICRYDIDEELELGYGKPLAQSVLHTGAQVVVLDRKTVSGKVVVKGELCLTVLYRPQDPEKAVETMEYALPFTQVADVPGLEEDWQSHVCYHVASLTVKPSGRQDAYGSRFSLSAVLTAAVDGYGTLAVNVVSDAYSTLYETSCTEKRLPVLSALGTISEQFSLKEKLDCPALREVLHLWLVPGTMQCRMEGGSAIVMMKASACLLGRDENGGILYHQQPWEVQQTVTLPGKGEQLFRPMVTLDNPGYALGSGEGQLRATMTVEGFLFGVEQVVALCDLTVAEESPKTPVSDLIYLYYADGSRTVWDVAKSHNAPCQRVMCENDLSEPDLRPLGLLLIPAGP